MQAPKREGVAQAVAPAQQAIVETLRRREPRAALTRVTRSKRANCSLQFTGGSLKDLRDLKEAKALLEELAA